MNLPKHVLVITVQTPQNTTLRQYRQPLPWPKEPLKPGDPFEGTWTVEAEGLRFSVPATVPTAGDPVEVHVTLTQKPETIEEQEVVRDEDNRVVRIAKNVYRVNPPPPKVTPALLSDLVRAQLTPALLSDLVRAQLASLALAGSEK